MIDRRTINSLWASLMIEELVRCGVDQFVICPGSRSTPLVLAVAQHPRARSIIHFDERGAAYFALGYARATGRPAALICTSGTAVANYLPAVIEASVDCVPTILLTADRPPELRDTGANQTITQPGIFSHYPRWEYDLECPSEQTSPHTLLAIIDQAVSHAVNQPVGPVHLNCMYREPLAPVVGEEVSTNYLASVQSWLSSDSPYAETTQPSPILNRSEMAEVAQVIQPDRRGLVIAGGLRSELQRRAVADLAEHLNWPLVADIGSGLRGGEIDSRIDYVDTMLTSRKFSEEHQPEIVLQFGSRLTSKRLLQFLSDASPARYMMVVEHPFRHDPIGRVTHRYRSDIALFCETLRRAVAEQAPNTWLTAWKRASQKVDAYLERTFANQSHLSEPLVARLISGEITAGTSLFLASSMPIRDMDQFADPRALWTPVATNRGASGIDGTIATAAGYAYGSRNRVTLLIGDLAFLHDLNSLALLSRLNTPVTVIVLNNNGGGIFGHLPIAGFEEQFEKFFVTPHGLTFARAAEMFSLAYCHPETVSQFVDVYRSAAAGAQSTLIEVPIDRAFNQQFHTSLLTEIAARLDSE